MVQIGFPHSCLLCLRSSSIFSVNDNAVERMFAILSIKLHSRIFFNIVG